MEVHRKYRLTEVECLTQKAYVQSTEISDRSRAQRFVITKRDLADRAGLVKGDKVVT